MTHQSALAAAVKSGIMLCFVGAFFTVLPSHFNRKLNSGNMTNVSVTMSTSKLSYVAKLSSDNTAGSSIIRIDTTSSPNGAPSNSTDNLFVGDNVLIGGGGTASNYLVKEATLSATTDRFAITPVIAAAGVGAGNAVISTRSATLSARFTTVSAIPNGAIRILVPAATSDASLSNDGIPDHTGFDFGSTPPKVYCPANNIYYAFDQTVPGEGVATPSAQSNVLLNNIAYHSFTCRYAGPGGIGVSMIATVSTIINPAAKNNHILGTADPYRIIVQNLNGSFAGDLVLDQTRVAVAPIDAVRVTATVPPILLFSINGIAAGESPCGAPTVASTSATLVPFGELAIDTFSDLAQHMSLSTNGTSGYVVTEQMNDQLTRVGQFRCLDLGVNGYGVTHGCIEDLNGSSETGVGINWSVTSQKGFGFSMRKDRELFGSFSLINYYDPTSSSCGGAGTFCARKFADLENFETPEPIWTSNGVADTHEAFMCYRAIIRPTQEAADYENNITYTATATF